MIHIYNWGVILKRLNYFFSLKSYMWDDKSLVKVKLNLVVLRNNLCLKKVNIIDPELLDKRALFRMCSVFD